MDFLLEIIVILILLELLRRWVIKVLKLEERNEKLQNKLDAMELLYGEMQEEIEITKKYRHDMKKHIRLLESILIKYNDEEISSDYIQTDNVYGLPQKNLYCDNIFIDTICTLKSKQCKEKGIYLYVSIHMKEFVPMKEIDISGLLQNLLDNAIEACERMADASAKSIYLSIQQKEEGWYLSIDNTCDCFQKFAFQTTKEDKENHGYGTGIIRDITEKYGGTVQYRKNEEERKMFVDIFFPAVSRES